MLVATVSIPQDLNIESAFLVVHVHHSACYYAKLLGQPIRDRNNQQRAFNYPDALRACDQMLTARSERYSQHKVAIDVLHEPVDRDVIR